MEVKLSRIRNRMKQIPLDLDVSVVFVDSRSVCSYLDMEFLQVAWNAVAIGPMMTSKKLSFVYIFNTDSTVILLNLF